MTTAGEKCNIARLDLAQGRVKEMGISKFRASVMIVAVLLTGCRAEKVEVRLTAEEIVAAANGQTASVGFETEVGERYTKVDSEKRAMIDAVAKLIEAKFPGADVEVDIGSDEYAIEIKGDVALSSSDPGQGAPWYISAQKVGDAISVSLLPSDRFGSFKTDMEALNTMIGPDEYQPVEFRFTASSGRVLVGGAYIDGVPTGFAEIPMSGQTVKMLFKGGVWEETSGTFLYIPN